MNDPDSKNSFLEEFNYVPIHLNDTLIKFNQGIYSYEKVEKYENLLIFNSARESKMTKIIQNIPIEKVTGGANIHIEPNDVFLLYPFEKIKQSVLSGLKTFGNWISIAIGVIGGIQILKAIISTIFSCAKARKVTNNRKDFISLVMSPISYIVDRLKNEQEIKNPELILEELRKLNKNPSTVKYLDLN